MTREPWCEVMDMPVSGCAHCRPRTKVEAATFAMFQTTCPGPDCGHRIEVGERIVLIRGEWHCTRCAR